MKKTTYIGMLVATLLTLAATTLTAQDVWGPNVLTLDPTPATEITPEMIGMTSLSGRQHPEFGVPVPNMPENTFELIDKRTEFTRTFVEHGTRGTHIYVQTGLQPLHFMHLGRWLSYDNRLEQTAYGVYATKSMPQTTVINTEEHSITIERNGPGDIFRFGQVTLKHVGTTGIETSLGPADWTHVTVGVNGMYITDAWNDIDFEIIFPPDAITLAECKTNIIIKSPLPFSDGELVIVDDVEFADMSVSSIESTVVFQSTTETEKEITFHPIVVVDNSGDRHAFTVGSYDFDITPTGTSLSMSVPLSWLQAPERVYPIVIDPLVTSTAALAAGSKDSGYGGSYCIGGNAANNCTYVLSAALPSDATITGASFNMVTQSNTTAACGSCYMIEQGIQIFGPCGVSPSPVLFWTCLLAAPGTCTGTALDMDALVTCLTPTCDSTIQFDIQTSYCYCSNNGTDCVTPLPCQRLNSFSVTIEGHTLEVPANVVNVTALCCIPTTIIALPTYGVAPYTYAWSTGETTSSISVTHCASTAVWPYTATCVITDACGNTQTVDYVFTVDCGLLPIQLTAFDAVWADGYVALTWETESELSSVEFVLERSYDGHSYIQIGTKNGAGTTNLAHTYVWNDSTPFVGQNYYRLSIIDDSGVLETAAIRTVHVPAAFDANVFPNPATASITVSVGEVKPDMYCEIKSIAGSHYTLLPVTETETVFETSTLEKGMYLVRIMTPSAQTVLKFIIE